MTISMYPGRDWPEDFPQENGNYLHTCSMCEEKFLGHKRRVSCKLCAPPVASLSIPEITIEERVAALEQKLAQFSPVTVMLRLSDGLVHPVTLFAKTIPAPAPAPFTIMKSPSEFPEDI